MRSISRVDAAEPLMLRYRPTTNTSIVNTAMLRAMLLAAITLPDRAWKAGA